MEKFIEINLMPLLYSHIILYIYIFYIYIFIYLSVSNAERDVAIAA